MKKKLSVLLFICCAILFVAPSIFAHELWIEVQEELEGEEVRVDIFWGHIRDFYDHANYEAYQLFVKKPNGEVDQLELEGIGVLGRAYLQLTDAGEYVFWALRNPGIYRPSEDQAALSNQMAKTVYVHGEGEVLSINPTEMPLEIVPQSQMQGFISGTFNATVYFDGEVHADAKINAYGPAGEILEATSAEDGSFELSLDSVGAWLIKANTRIEESGDLAGENYDFESRTTTFLIQTTDASVSEIKSGDADYSAIMMALVFIAGILIGAAMVLVIVKKKKSV